MDMEISTFGYGILALTNPNSWPNDNDDNTVDYFITGKEIYVWALIFEAYILRKSSRRQLSFENDVDKIEHYIRRYYESHFKSNPVDFSNAGGMYTAAKPGSFQSIRSKMGAAAKAMKIPAAQQLLTNELSLLEEQELIVDPLTETIAGISFLVVGSIPFSFTKRTENGDIMYRKVKALLWEFEQLNDGEKKEVRFHFFMEQAVQRLKKVVHELSAPGALDQNDEEKH